MPARAFLLLYALSGAAALLYEVTWLRLLALHLGHTVAAVSTVLTAFMGGLAVGAALAGRRAEGLTPAGALRACALFEVLIAFSALLVPLALAAAQPLVGAAYADGAGGWFGVTRVAVALAALAVPTLAMGATFPMAVRALGGLGRSKDRPLHGGAGDVYAANTIGAAVGAAATGFFLLPALGLRGATFVGVAINLIVATGFLVVLRAHGAQGAQGAGSGAGVAAQSTKRTRTLSTVSTMSTLSTSSAGSAGVLLAIGISGFIALAYEVAWTRVLAMVIGPTIYAFSGMLVTFIAGLAVGATIGARVARRLTSGPGIGGQRSEARGQESVSRLRAALAVTFLIAAAGSAAALALAGRGPLVVGSWVARPDASFGWIVAAELALTGALLLPITLAFGAAFPLALAAAGRSDASSAARVYVANTAGAIAGSLAAGWMSRRSSR